MDESRGEDKERTSDHPERCYCPVCTFTRALKETRRKHSGFFEHFHNARIEMLRAVRSLVDERIASIEKAKAAEEAKDRVTKVEVE
jgi:hypothetical protein